MKSLFVSIDGPKGTGKTTLLEGLERRLRLSAGEGVAIERWSEKDRDPTREEVRRLLELQRLDYSRDRELEIVAMLAEGRAIISAQIAETVASRPTVLLIDRWYPSDAVFRRGIPFAECLRANRANGVRVPDLVVALQCDAQVSWSRACERPRGLDSSVILNFGEHKASTDSFDRAVREYNWFVVNSELDPSVCVRMAEARILSLSSKTDSDAP